jgi:hypothetical protein
MRAQTADPEHVRGSMRRNGQTAARMSAEVGTKGFAGRDAHSPVGPADQVGRA